MGVGGGGGHGGGKGKWEGLTVLRGEDKGVKRKIGRRIKKEIMLDWARKRMVRKKAGRMLAMGPYLSAGILLAALWGNKWISWYLSLIFN